MNKERIEKIIAFVSQLDENQFEGGMGIIGNYDKPDMIACAIGWLPKIFPDDYYYHNATFECFSYWTTCARKEGIELFLDIPKSHANHLFGVSIDSELIQKGIQYLDKANKETFINNMNKYLLLQNQ